MDANLYPRTVAAAADYHRYERLARRIPLTVCASFVLITALWLLWYLWSFQFGVSSFTGTLGLEMVALFTISLFVMFEAALTWPAKNPLGERLYSSWLNSTLAGLLGYSKKRATRQHATVCAEALDLASRAQYFKITGDDRIVEIVSAKIVSLRASVQTLLSQIEGIDSQTEGDFGQRFLDQAGQTAVKLSNELADLEYVRANHACALLFDTKAGRKAALELVASQLVQ